jgi:hypothetical protein
MPDLNDRAVPGIVEAARASMLLAASALMMIRSRIEQMPRERAGPRRPAGSMRGSLNTA